MLFADGHELRDDLINIDIVLSKLNSCSNDADFDVPGFSTIHNMESDDYPLT